MASLYEEEEYRFFDAQDSIGSVELVSEPEEVSHDDLVQYDVWTVAPKSVHQRKNIFLRLMGLSSGDQILEDDTIDKAIDDRITPMCGAVLRTTIEEEQQQELEDSLVSPSICNLYSVSRIQDSVCEEDGCKLSEIITPPMVKKLVDRRIKVADTMARTMNKVKGRFLGSLRSMACNIVHKQGKSSSLKSREIGSPNWAKVQRVKVHQNKKKLKELSAVFMSQDFQAHQASILTMKFSLDGRYLASAGEDLVVRVWQVVEDERLNVYKS